MKCYRCNKWPCKCRDGVTIICGDSSVLAPRIVADAVVTDPPYGMRWNTNSKRFSGGDHKRGDGRDDHEVINGDDRHFDPRPWISRYRRCVFWGYHHFASRLAVGTVLVWIKRNDDKFGTFLSDCELAWMTGGHGVYAFRKLFPPPVRMQETATKKTVHPNQKPIALMAWCIAKLKTPGVILDPYMGSGTTLVAAKKMGRRAIGIDDNPKLCETAAARLEIKQAIA